MIDKNLLILTESIIEDRDQLLKNLSRKEKQGGFCTILQDRQRAEQESSPQFIKLMARLLDDNPVESVLMMKDLIGQSYGKKYIDKLEMDFPAQSWMELSGEGISDIPVIDPKKEANFRQLTRSISNTYDLQSIRENLNHLLPLSGIGCCSLFSFERSRSGGSIENLLPPEEAHRVYSLEGDVFAEEKLVFGQEGITLLRWVPQNCHRLLLPIAFDGEVLGFLLMEYNREISLDCYEDFRISLGSFFMGLSRSEELKSLSLYDHLTQIYNLRGFYTLGEQMINQSRRLKVPLCLFYCDIYKLDEINQSKGREGGDQVLKDTAGMLHTLFRKNDVVARVGDDEFAILALGVSEENEITIKNRMDKARLDMIENRENAIAYELQISVSRMNPEDPLTLRELLTMTDYLMDKEES